MSLLIWRFEKAFHLHLVGKRLETDHNISIFRQTLHPESPQPINHITTDGFNLFFYVFLSLFFPFTSPAEHLACVHFLFFFFFWLNSREYSQIYMPAFPVCTAYKNFSQSNASQCATQCTLLICLCNCVQQCGILVNVKGLPKAKKDVQKIKCHSAFGATVRATLCDFESITQPRYATSPSSLSLCRGQVMVAEALDISRETYFAILMDRSCNGPVMVGSPQGGMDIEEVAASNPELIFKVYDLLLFWMKCTIQSCLLLLLLLSSLPAFILINP